MPGGAPASVITSCSRSIGQNVDTATRPHPVWSITATSVVVDGTELAHNLNGIAPRDPDRQHSFYIDASGVGAPGPGQADRSGFPRLAVLTFPASALQVGDNTLTLTRGPGTAAGNGLGWDTLVLEVDEASAPPPARLAGEVAGVSRGPSSQVWTIRITNLGDGAANDVRLDGFALGGRAPQIAGRDPNRFPVPVAGSLPPGGAVTADVTVLDEPPGVGLEVTIPFSANGGRTRGVIAARG